MGFKLDKVIPWGRSATEYQAMFHLTSYDCQLAILDCAGGPASFNAEMTRQGSRIISGDPIYQFTADEINRRIQATHQTVLEGVKANLESYNWREFESPEQLVQVRMAAMQTFLEDLSVGIEQGRYVTCELPSLPFQDRQFDLALCSHFLFTYSDHFSEAFHLNSLLELCRVATEVRIFPIVNISGETSPFCQSIQQELERQGYQVEIQSVSYEFQKGANQMLRVKKGDS